MKTVTVHELFGREVTDGTVMKAADLRKECGKKGYKLFSIGVKMKPLGGFDTVVTIDEVKQ